MNNTLKQREARGFTLLELLIVIAIIAILSVILIIVINPAETLKKSRDVQRMSDLNTMKTAMGLLLTSSSTPLLSGTAANTLCKNGTTPTIWYSYPLDAPGAPITDTTLDGTAGVNVDAQVSAANLSKPDGTGWMPVAFTGLPGGSPISNLPIDPVNTATVGGILATDLVYRYACDKNDLTFEFGAVLESTAYVTTDPKMTNDGGNNVNYYETGTKLTILDGVTNPY